MRFLIIFLCCNLWSVFAKYTTLDDALLNGSKKVDIVLYGKHANNGGYINGSIGLGYITGFYYNLRAAISFRAAQSFYSSSDWAFRQDFGGNYDTLLGNSAISLGESFLEYFDGDTAIKMGRFQPINEYVNTLIDGLWVRNGSFKDLTIDGIWAYRNGRVNYFEISPFARLGSAGWFHVGLKYFLANRGDIKDSMYASIFSMFVPNIYTSFGARWHSGFRFNGSETWLGIDVGFAGSFENTQNRLASDSNTFLFDSKISFGFSWLDVMAGYVISGQGGMGGINSVGVGNGTQADMQSIFYTNIQPFFVWGGNAIKIGRNAHLLYAATRLGLFEDKLNIYVAYGITFFEGYSGRYGSNGIRNTQAELNVMAEFAITRTLNAILHVSNAHFASNAPNPFQINGGFRFMF